MASKVTTDLSQIDMAGLSKVCRGLVIEAFSLGWSGKNLSGGGVQLMREGQNVPIPGNNTNLSESSARSMELKLRRFADRDKLTEWLKPKARPRPTVPDPIPETPALPRTETPVTTIKTTGLKLKAEVRTVTPDDALEWLTDPKFKSDNRRLRKTKIATYARDIKAGRWQITGEAIKFDIDGRLVDGQHRLTAIVEAGVAIQTLVITGVQTEAKNVMDTGASRTASDILGINGYNNRMQVAAAARILCAMDRGELYPLRMSAEASNDEVLEYVQRNSDLVELQSNFGMHLRRIPVRPAVALAALKLIYDFNGDEASEFFTRLGEGTDLSSGNPIHTLRERLRTAELSRERHTPYENLSAILRMFLAWRSGDQVKRLQFYSSGPAVDGIGLRNAPIPIPTLR